MLIFNYKFFIFYLLFICCVIAHGQHKTSTKIGNLFIIGGGKRTPELMKSLLKTANLSSKDYIMVLPMASEEQDTAFYYFKTSLEGLCSNTVVEFNSKSGKDYSTSLIDSVKNAKLIFICGGDQDRFMKAVINTSLIYAIRKAYQNGSTISGTSAGAAVMSKYMITGNELKGDTTYHETFRRVHANNLELKQGLGLVENAIIDQHFIARSRYNRLFSAIAEYPNLTAIGIDESTAIIIHDHNVEIAGNSQVVVLSHPQKLQILSNGLIKFKNIQCSFYTAGDHFYLP